MEENKEILYLLDIAINSYIENDILRLDVSDTTKNRLKRDLRKKFRDEGFIIEQYQNMLATNDMLHVLECEKKDKIIDEMAIYINNFDIDEDICKKVDEPCKNYAGENGKLCNECIIKYFTNKVEREGK